MTMNELEKVLTRVRNNTKEKKGQRAIANLLLEIIEDLNSKNADMKAKAKTLSANEECGRARVVLNEMESYTKGSLNVLTRISAYLFPIYMRKDDDE